MKKYYLFISIAALIGFSSCASLRVDKRQHSNGWYIDFGTDKKSETATMADKQEEATLAEEAQVPVVSTSEAPNLHNVGARQSDVMVDEVPVVAVAAEEPASPATNSDGGTATTINKNENANHSSDPSEVSQGSDDQLLLVILAIFIPPLAVYMVQGATAIFWITLICFLFGGAFLFGGFGYRYLGGLGLLAIILALLVVFGKL